MYFQEDHLQETFSSFLHPIACPEVAFQVPIQSNQIVVIRNYLNKNLKPNPKLPMLGIDNPDDILWLCGLEPTC